MLICNEKNLLYEANTLKSVYGMVFMVEKQVAFNKINKQDK